MVLIKTLSRLGAIALDKLPGRHATTVRRLEFLDKQVLRPTRNAQTLWEHCRDRARGRSSKCGMDARAPDLHCRATPSCSCSRPGHQTAHKIVQGHRRLMPIETAQLTGELGGIARPGLRLVLRSQDTTLKRCQHC